MVAGHLAGVRGSGGGYRTGERKGYPWADVKITEEVSGPRTECSTRAKMYHKWVKKPRRKGWGRGC